VGLRSAEPVDLRASLVVDGCQPLTGIP